MLGARLVQHHPFDIEVLITQIETERVTYTCAPPAVLDNLVATPDVLAGHDISSLRAVGSGSAPLAGWMIEAWERGRGVEVLNLFGSNEGLCLFGCPDTIPDPAERGRLFPRPGDQSFNWRTRIGRETKSRLVDVETGEDIFEPGHPGELRVSSPAIIAGYWGDAPSPFDEQGYLPHRRHLRDHRRRRPPAGVRRPGQGPDQPRRLQDLGGRDRVTALGSPEGSRGRRRRHARRAAGRAAVRLRRGPRPD